MTTRKQMIKKIEKELEHRKEEIDILEQILDILNGKIPPAIRQQIDLALQQGG